MKHELDQGQEIFSSPGNPITDEDVRYAYFEGLVQMRANAYKFRRREEYPSIGDQLDALWKGGEAAAAMAATIQEIKAKYPKGE